MKVRTSRGQQKKRLHHHTFFQQIVFFCAMILLGGWLFWNGASLSEASLQVWFFDVGQGDAVLIKTPHGHQVLVDGGPDQTILSKLGSVLLPWDRTIDVVIATHNDADHVTGLRTLAHAYAVEQVMAAEDMDWEVGETLLQQGDRFVFDEVVFEVLWPTQEAFDDRSISDNEQSLVLLVTYEETTILLTGDLESAQEAQQEWPDVDVLKVAHHGSASSSSLDFLFDVRAETAVISCGKGNPYGHPHPVVLDRLEQAETRVLRTDQDGDVLLLADGGEPEVFFSPLPF
ncbi:TPA: hypothetical protein DEP34_05090 [Candidatus Uhrbacteria bacterium]|uniref:Competence protein ComEC n=2 Tax=Candidatus Uhriibacteriota TaxID=1752732 RepID=A0A0G1Q6S1_9BACT|nr:MAG: Competence protein ComEC [Candidatus Uhrbacteria bacterium GW2011_GWF2_46_218]KKU40746.1 MAG: Competence protein ComEC [Candidatus Uhrbacteria bacterium GW2011_GWE2_46_68]HBK33571.1 hypothetical protein [Candidatus Uhrbacteria bacterium]HCB19714.1 hypothetical protein [Candidatus Uhrbacteria bacterium]